MSSAFSLHLASSTSPAARAPIELARDVHDLSNGLRAARHSQCLHHLLVGDGSACMCAIARSTQIAEVRPLPVCSGDPPKA